MRIAKEGNMNETIKKLLITLAIIALFALGVFIGMHYKFGQKRAMTSQDCGILKTKISDTVSEIKTFGISSERLAKLKEANEFYEKQCDEVETPPTKEALEPVQKQEKLPAKNCEAIERVLLQRVYEPDNNELGYNARINNATWYSRIADRGCVENKEKYKALAFRELEIARALQDDRFYNDNEVIEIVETYKKIDMKREAEKVFEKAKKLTDPAIDFIIQVERIIND
jgi:hypothetical protein